MRFRFEGIGRDRVNQLSHWWFASLTMGRAVRRLPIPEQVRATGAAWTKLYARIRRKTVRPVPYLVVFEQHQNGVPHVHFLIAAPLTRNWLRNAWQACGGGQQIDVHRCVHPDFRVHYMSKHLLAWPLFALPRGFRRFRYGGGLNMQGVRPRPRRKTWSSGVQSPPGGKGEASRLAHQRQQHPDLGE
jgi:hypothetical protein